MTPDGKAPRGPRYDGRFERPLSARENRGTVPPHGSHRPAARSAVL